MTPIQIERNRAFLADLRANQVKAMRKFRNDLTGGRCCLCVAWDSAVNHGFQPEESECTIDEVPHEELADYYGWPSVNPELKFFGERRQASEWNDGNPEDRRSAISHVEIADAFEQTFPELKTPEA